MHPSESSFPSPLPEGSEVPLRAHRFLIYVSGNNASGKSTLGAGLAMRFGVRHLPEEKFDTSYLDDLFYKQHRWCFEAQVHFLSFKVNLVRASALEEASAFVDRSPYEDAEVFARYFFDTGKMDRRSYRTYRSLYGLFQVELPEPDLFIWCDCPPDALESRVSSRGRRYEELYPENHLHHLDSLYRDWLATTLKRFPNRVYRVDSQIHDFRLSYVVDSIAAEVKGLLSTPMTRNQLSLFDTATDTPRPLEFLQPMTAVAAPRRAARRRKLKAYIAAPFTGKATLATPTPEGEAEGAALFDSAPAPPHGTISDPAYRHFLEGIERIVSESGFDTFVPHRDVNKWGLRLLRPEQAATECTKHVFEADIVVALTGKSLGAHYEVGVALGYGLTVVLLIQEGDDTSFLMEGLHQQFRVHEVRFATIEDLRGRLTAVLTSLASGRQA